jgi:DNA-directed RNA polymerase subunit RPC12/RpoP
VRMFLVLVPVLCLFTLGCSSVQEGRVVTCKGCGKQLQNDVRTLQVPPWDANNHRVEHVNAWCEVCGRREVPYQVHYKCQRCGTEYSATTEYAPQSADEHDKWLTEGYCSTGCMRTEEVSRKVGEAADRTGQVLGGAVKGLLHGLRH